MLCRLLRASLRRKEPGAQSRPPFETLALLGSGNLRGHFGSEVVRTLFDAFADHEQRKLLHRRACGLQHLFDRLLVVLNERLVQQRDLLQVFLNATVDHLRDDLSRLARFRSLLLSDAAFLRD